MTGRRAFRAAVAATIVASGLVLPVRPASAVSAGTLTIVGAAALACPGFGYLVAGGISPVTCPFVFGSAVCVDNSVNVLKPKPVAVTGPVCVLGAAGLVTGWCGLAYGTGAGMVVDSTGAAIAVDFIFNVVGNNVVFTGSAAKPPQGGVFHAVGEAVAPTPVLTPAGGSCTVGTAVVFDMVAAGAYELA